MKYTSIYTLAAIAGLALTATNTQAASIMVSSYTYEAGGVPQGGQTSLYDAGNSKLTDGNYPISNWNDGTNVGFANGSNAQKAVGKPSVTFDLGGLFDLTSVDIWSEEQFTNGEESVTISSSTDGLTWSPTTVADSLDFIDQGAVYGDKVTVGVSSLATGRYFKMVFADSGQWMMLTEIDFEGTAVPEPSTFALLGLAGLVFLLRRQR